MKLSTFKHTEQEKKRYTISYADWLDDGEVLDSVLYAIDNVTVPPLLVESSAIQGDGLGVTFFVSGGLDEEQYQLNVLMETDAGQRKEDYMTIVVENP
jgi:hypothetical protein